MASAPPRRGRVVAFDEHRGLGTIRDVDGAEWPFHCTCLADGSRTVAPGTSVVFEIAPGAPGRWEATGIVILT